MKIKNLVKCVDTLNVREKTDCFQRGDDWYEVEPKWDRKESVMEYCWVIGIEMPTNKYYKEFEVHKDGEPKGYVRAGKLLPLEVKNYLISLDDFLTIVALMAFTVSLTSCIWMILNAGL